MLHLLSLALLMCIIAVSAQNVPDGSIVNSHTSLKLQVASYGGNATSPLQYGIM